MLDTGDTVLNVVPSVCPQELHSAGMGFGMETREGAVCCRAAGEDRALDWAVVWRSRGEWTPVMC